MINFSVAAEQAWIGSDELPYLTLLVSTLTAQHHPACYPSDPAKALAFFKDAFEIAYRDSTRAARRPLWPASSRPTSIFASACRAYAAAFRPLLDEPLAENYFILGVGHRSRLEWNFDRRDYVTPLGRAVCATDLVDALVGRSRSRAPFLCPTRMKASTPSSSRSSGCRRCTGCIPRPRRQREAGPLRSAFLRRPAPLCRGRCGMGRPRRFSSARRDLAAPLREISAGRKTARHRQHRRLPHGAALSASVSRHAHAAQGDRRRGRKCFGTCAAQGDARKFLDWFRDEGNVRYFDGVGALALLLAAGAAENVHPPAHLLRAMVHRARRQRRDLFQRARFALAALRCRLTDEKAFFFARKFLR